MRILTAEQMQSMEKRAHEGGMAYAQMMDHAGHATALAAGSLLSGHDDQVLVLIGPGNNGGDGLVAARYLRQMGASVTACIWKRSRDDEDGLLAAAADAGVSFLWADKDQGFQALGAAVRQARLVIDALLGTGVEGSLRGTLPDLLQEVRRNLAEAAVSADLPVLLDPLDTQVTSQRPTIVAVDLPSGLNTDTGEIDALALPADVTVTFAAPKRGHFLFPGAEHVGRLLVADIGIAVEDIEAPEMVTAQQIADWLPARPAASHKGSFGKAMVVAGSANFVGAPCLAAEGAYRAGAGLVTLGVSSSVYPLAAAKLSEATFLLLPSDMGSLVLDAVPLLADALAGYDALLLGPGLGTAPSTEAFVARLLSVKRPGRRGLGFATHEEGDDQRLTLPPMVIDADGLNLLARMPEWWRGLPPGTIITPHPGEMSRLTGSSVEEIQGNRWEIASEMAAKWQCIVVLKGPGTVIAAPDQAPLISPIATAALATAGTGDVLAGLIVGLLAQGMAPREAAAAGVFLHGLAGHEIAQQNGDAGMLAGELLPRIPAIMQRLRHKGHDAV